LGEISLSSQAENVRPDLTPTADKTLHYASQTPNCRFKLHERSQLFIGVHNETSGGLTLCGHNPRTPHVNFYARFFTVRLRRGRRISSGTGRLF
jgi:hypothetical protein